MEYKIYLILFSLLIQNTLAQNDTYFYSYVINKEVEQQCFQISSKSAYCTNTQISHKTISKKTHSVSKKAPFSTLFHFTNIESSSLIGMASISTRKTMINTLESGTIYDFRMTLSGNLAQKIIDTNSNLSLVLKDSSKNILPSFNTIASKVLRNKDQNDQETITIQTISLEISSDPITLSDHEQSQLLNKRLKGIKIPYSR
ncbi:MAG: hypothetical protein JKY89_00985 [Immundisolibacteraceae bacterium]|nr:hypothetical protein [Immundisolibacteraceae bacterium]